MARTGYEIRRRSWRWFAGAKRRAAPFYPVPTRFGPLGRQVARFQPAGAMGAKAGLTVVVLLYLMVAAFFPGGSNTLFGLNAPSIFSYLPVIGIGDALGFYKTRGQDGFIVYKIYTQDGRVVEGAFPDPEISPRLRYDRWALLSHYVNAENPAFHEAFLRYLVGRLPSAPVKLELLSAKWDWSRGNGSAELDPKKHGGLLVLRKLGTYDGLRKRWNPISPENRK